MEIQHFFDPETSTLTYVVHQDGRGVVIDPVLDFDPRSGRTSTGSAERVAAYLDARGIDLPFVLDTHAHADHLSGLPFFAARHGARTAIGRHITRVQEVFRDIYHLGHGFPTDGSQFDLLLDDGEKLDVGPFQIAAMHTPGHTPACMSYRIEDALFVGDTLFQPDYGTARCDFPGGSSETLHASIQRIYALPDAVRVFTGHDYQPGGRELAFESTVGEHKRENRQLRAETPVAEFVALRDERDASLALPALLIPSIQVNIRAGALPEPEANGVSYLKTPLNLLGGPR